MPQVTSSAASQLGERIRKQRELLGVSQEDIAALAEIHVSNFGKIERGLANPSLHTILRIAEVLNVNPGLLVDGLTADQLTGRTHKLTAADLIAARGNN